MIARSNGFQSWLTTLWTVELDVRPRLQAHIKRVIQSSWCQALAREGHRKLRVRWCLKWRSVISAEVAESETLVDKRFLSNTELRSVSRSTCQISISRCTGQIGVTRGAITRSLGRIKKSDFRTPTRKSQDNNQKSVRPRLQASTCGSTHPRWYVKVASEGSISKERSRICAVQATAVN